MHPAYKKHLPSQVPKLGDIEGIWTEDDKRELDEGFVAEVATHVIAQEHGQFVLRPWHLQQTTLSQEDFLSSSTIDALRETGEGRPAVVPDQATLGKIVRGMLSLCQCQNQFKYYFTIQTHATAECMANEGYPNIMTPSMDDYNLFRVMYWRAVHNENFVLGTVREIDPQVLGRIDELCAQCVYTEVRRHLVAPLPTCSTHLLHAHSTPGYPLWTRSPRCACSTSGGIRNNPTCLPTPSRTRHWT